MKVCRDYDYRETVSVSGLENPTFAKQVVVLSNILFVDWTLKDR